MGVKSTTGFPTKDVTAVRHASLLAHRIVHLFLVPGQAVHENGVVSCEGHELIRHLNETETNGPVDARRIRVCVLNNVDILDDNKAK